MEEQLLVFQMLSRKEGHDVGDVGHWVASLPQDLAKCLCQTWPEFDALCRYIDDSMSECGAPLRTYDGFSDDTGSPVRYIQDNPVVVFRRNFYRAKQVLKDFLPRFRQAGLTLLDFAKQSDFAVCTLELPKPPNDDLVMNGPFEEPDSYYLCRQNATCGSTHRGVTA